MKLTQRDKVVLSVLAILLVLFIGIWFVARPAFQEVQTNKQEYNKLRADYSAKQEQVQQKEHVKEDVKVRYEECVALTDNFYDREPAYEIAEQIFNIMADCGIVGTSATISETAKTLMTYSYDGGSNIIVPLDEYANVNDTTTAEEAALAAIQEVLANQTVGCYSFTVGFDHMTKENIFEFVEKLRDGDKKTLVITNLSFDITEAEVDGGASGDVSLELYYMKAPEEPVID